MPIAPKNPKPWIAFTVAVALFGIAWTLAEARLDPRPNSRHPAIVDSAYFAFALWAGAVLMQEQATAVAWFAGSSAFRVARAAWLGGLAGFLVPLGLAFHLAHDWSHARAFDHVEATSGFGPGLFASYGFSLIWLIDGAVWVVGPGWYARRPKWIAAMLHGAMVFIWINATVVFGQSPLRWIAAGVLALLLGQLLKNRLLARAPLRPLGTE